MNVYAKFGVERSNGMEAVQKIEEKCGLSTSTHYNNQEGLQQTTIGFDLVFRSERDLTNNV